LLPPPPPPSSSFRGFHLAAASLTRFFVESVLLDVPEDSGPLDLAAKLPQGAIQFFVFA